jgi:hypothetical protein
VRYRGTAPVSDPAYLAGRIWPGVSGHPYLDHPHLDHPYLDHPGLRIARTDNIPLSRSGQLGASRSPAPSGPPPSAQGENRLYAFGRHFGIPLREIRQPVRRRCVEGRSRRKWTGSASADIGERWVEGQKMTPILRACQPACRQSVIIRPGSRASDLNCATFSRSQGHSRREPGRAQIPPGQDRREPKPGRRGDLLRPSPRGTPDCAAFRTRGPALSRVNLGRHLELSRSRCSCLNALDHGFRAPGGHRRPQ